MSSMYTQAVPAGLEQVHARWGRERGSPPLAAGRSMRTTFWDRPGFLQPSVPSPTVASSRCLEEGQEESFIPSSSLPGIGRQLQGHQEPEVASPDGRDLP